MKYRVLGKTGLKISEIGYGTWQFANDNECWIGATRKESERALLTAIDLGLNFIDTARSYGDGLAEKWIGEIVKQRSEKEILISSKILPLNWQWPARKGTPINEVFPKSHIINQVEGSLKSLGREYLDIMMFHVWQDEWAIEDEWKETVQRLTRQGKVKFWGISTNNHESTNCIKACGTGLIQVVETIFNLFYQEPIKTLFPFAKKENIGLIARVPLDEGGLSGKISKQTVFEKGDFRSTYFSSERLADLDKRLKRINEDVDKLGLQSVPELALRFILSFPEITTAIPGMRKAKHVTENMAVTEMKPFTVEEIELLSRHVWNRNFYGNNPWEENA